LISLAFNINYKKIYLGFYKNLDDAIKARKEGEQKYYETKNNTTFTKR
jgi:hypothetical protein